MTSSGVAETVLANRRRQEAEAMFERLRANFNTFNTRQSMCSFVESLARPKVTDTICRLSFTCVILQNSFETFFDTFMDLMPIKFNLLPNPWQKS